MKVQNKNFRVKLRLMVKTISPGYAIYDSVYSYCPSKSLVISSRHNIVFHSQMISTILKEVS
jgi:hypothetical protein